MVGIERVISAWSKWTFDINIRDIITVQDRLYLFVDNNTICYIELGLEDVSNSTGSDLGTNPYKSMVTLSKFNIPTNQGTQNITDDFYTKTIKVNKNGLLDLKLINKERNTEKIVKSKFLDRNLFVGSNSNKIKIQLYSEYDTGCEINTINLKGSVKTRSRNI